MLAPRRRAFFSIRTHSNFRECSTASGPCSQATAAGLLQSDSELPEHPSVVPRVVCDAEPLYHPGAGPQVGRGARIRGGGDHHNQITVDQLFE